MKDIENLIFSNFNLLFGFAAVWCIAWFSWLLWRRKKSGIFSDIPSNVIYEEKTASGRSHKNWYSKIGGAKNCLRLLVTGDELWVTPISPFSALAETFDMNHRIKTDSIVDVIESKLILKKSLLIKYSDNSGGMHLVEVIPKNMQKFRQALNK